MKGGSGMGCTKAQLLALIDFILGEIASSRDKEEAYKRVLRIRSRIQEYAFEEILKELGL